LSYHPRLKREENHCNSLLILAFQKSNIGQKGRRWKERQVEVKDEFDDNYEDGKASKSKENNKYQLLDVL